MIQKDYYQRLITKTLKDKIPLSVAWELTAQCNLSCRHCYVVAQDKKPELSKEEIESILEQLAQSSCLYLIFTGGEIFTRDDFFEIAHSARSKGFGLRLLTNGTLINSKIADGIKELEPISVEISLYGMSPAVHEAITRVPGSYNKTITSLRLLKQRGLNIVIKSFLMQENIWEFDRLKAFSQELQAGFVFDFTIVAKTNGDKGPFQYMASDDDLSKFFSTKIKLSKGRTTQIPADSPICNAGLNTVFISSAGEVYPCIAIREMCGDLRKESFAQIWEKSEVLSYIRSIKFSDLKQCPNCSLIPYCNRCPGQASLEDRDILGPSQVACGMAKIHESVLNTVAVGVENG